MMRSGGLGFADPATIGVATALVRSLNLEGLFGLTSAEKRARSELSALASRLTGNPTTDEPVLRQLAFYATEKREGRPGDLRTPIDGKRSIGWARSKAAKMIRDYGALAQVPGTSAPVGSSPVGSSPVSSPVSSPFDGGAPVSGISPTLLIAGAVAVVAMIALTGKPKRRRSR